MVASRIFSNTSNIKLCILKRSNSHRGYFLDLVLSQEYEIADQRDSDASNETGMAASCLHASHSLL